MDLSLSFSCPQCLGDHLSQEGRFYRPRGHCPALGQFLQKLQRQRVQAACARLHTPPPPRRKWGQVIYSRRMNQIVSSHFCFFGLPNALSCFQGSPGGVAGRKDGGREEIPASVGMGESVLKQSILMSHFHFLENTCAIVGGHGYPPRAPRRGKMRGGRAICQGGAPPRSTGTCRAEGRGHPCLQGGSLEWPAPSKKALM